MPACLVWARSLSTLTLRSQHDDPEDQEPLHSNGPKCQELGWSCIPLAVETYGNWGNEAHDSWHPTTSPPRNQQWWQKFMAG
ncbi:hypothetical protein EMCRGX_G021752 [Ephydatia muelleri]